MHTELYSISKLFTETLLRIPDYQRGYAWTEKQIREFWSDLEQLPESNNHYTGVLTLEEAPASAHRKWEDDRWIIDAKRFKPYYVVDGQQRLTTIVILLQALIDKLGPAGQVNYTSTEELTKKFIFETKQGGISRSYIFGYEKDNPSYEFLKNKILCETSDHHSTGEETIYTHNLATAKQFFANEIGKLSDKALEQLHTKVTQHLLFNIYTISNDIDVFVAFETMNNRGKPLSHLELLKTRLIYLSTKLEVEREERDRLRRTINESWKTLYHYLGKNKLQPLNDDHFLRVHFFTHVFTQLNWESQEDGPVYDDQSKWFALRRVDRYKDYLLERLFTGANLHAQAAAVPKPPRLNVEYIYAYSQDIKKAVKLYYELFNPVDSAIPDSEKIYLTRIGRLLRLDQLLLVMAVYLNSSASPLRLRFLVAFERMLFLQTILPYQRRVDEELIVITALRLMRREYELSAVVDLLDNAASQSLKDVDFASVIGEWVRRQGAYGWDGIKYFLFEYEQFLREATREKREKLRWLDFANERYDEDYSTVEHVYPQKASLDCWKKAFDSFSVKERNVLRNGLGNLLPLSRPKNSTLRNHCFATKRGDATNKIGYAYGCYSEIEVSHNKKWEAEEILLRGVALLSFLERRWSIPLGDKYQKVQILGLDFVLGKIPALHGRLKGTA